jgi:hypothetical protein
MSSPKAPTPPDPVTTANAQTAMNEKTARTEAELNRVNQVTPYGSVTYNNQGDRWTQTVTESPEEKRLRELSQTQGQKLGELGISQTDRVTDLLSKPYESRRFDVNAATGGPLNLADALGGDFDASKYDPSTLGNFGDDVRQRSFDLATQGLDAEFDRSEESLRTRLANQGVNAGTEAFGSEMESFNTGKGDAFARALLAADDNATRQRAQATSELGQGFAQDVAGRGQSLAELLTQRDTNLGDAERQYGFDTTADLADRQNPLNEIIALMSGVQTTPINPGQAAATRVAPTDYSGLVQSNYGQAVNAANAQGAANASTGGAVAGLAGTALMVF